MIRKFAFIAWWRRFWPQPILVNRREQIAATIGAAIGLIGTECFSQLTLGSINPWFIAPMGASAILLFGVPASPLAQPWSIIGGNLIAALIGVSCVYLFDSTSIAAGFAVAIAIALMFPLRCLHPPSGAVALTAVLGGPAITKLGYAFVFYPVLVNSLLLTLIALLFNNCLRSRYPHHKVPVKKSSVLINQSLTEQQRTVRQDLHAVLTKRGELLDVDEDDLEEILQQVETRTRHRRLSKLRCFDIMKIVPLTLKPETTCEIAIKLLKESSVEILVVVSPTKQALGIVTLHDLLLLEAKTRMYINLTVDQIMDKNFHASRGSDTIQQLIPNFLDQRTSYSLVLDEAYQLVGVIMMKDIIAALFKLN